MSSMNYELAKELKDAGFPQDYSQGVLAHFVFEADDITSDSAYEPTLSELIEACGDRFF